MLHSKGISQGHIVRATWSFPRLSLVSTKISTLLGQIPSVFLASLPPVVKRIQNSSVLLAAPTCLDYSSQRSSQLTNSLALTNLIDFIYPKLDSCSFSRTACSFSNQFSSLSKCSFGLSINFESSSLGLDVARRINFLLIWT